MIPSQTVLVLTQQLDAHADLVIHELNRRNVPVMRFDTADFPQRATLIAHTRNGKWEGTLLTQSHSLELEHIASIWYRRPAPFELDPALPPSGQQFASAEARMAIGGLLRSAHCLWVNHPEKIVSADYKPWQLQVASDCGLDIPASLLTNEPTEVFAFFEQCRSHMIYKTLSGGLIISESGEAVSIYTSRVTLDDLRMESERVRSTACLFQELVPKKVELRITIVGNRVFSAEISYRDPDQAALDWRTAYQNLQYRVYDLPEEIRRKCLAFMKQLGLLFAALDIIVTPDDRYIFVEANACGQWSWIQNATGLPICETLVDLLVGRANGVSYATT
ncbi:MAG: ATP-grasp ribosomal peptide maturase [Ktedonobacteraceae bacterium]|nr:ATP-grasp ribosomal peptide maturase [Ktedonobacteraceae bacterium]